MIRRCLNCGTEYEGRPDSTLCPACAAKSRAGAVVRDRICRQCGATFRGGPRAWYCPSCRKQRQKDRAQRYRAQGFARHLGDIDHCELCGKEYVVTSGRQRFCKDCAALHLKQVDQAQSRAWNRENVDMAARKQDRHAAAAQIKCAVCGKLFTPGQGSPVTCSPECQEIYRKQLHQTWESDHKAQRNDYHNDLERKKVSAMSEEERKAYRQYKNNLAREAYAKRLAAMTPEELAEFREKRKKQCHRKK